MFNKEKALKESGLLSELTYWVLLVLAVVLPVWLFWGGDVPVLMTKVFVGGSLVLLSLVLFSIAHIRMQEISIPRSLILASVWLIPLAYIMSTLFAPKGGSFFGERLLMDSPMFVIIVAVATTVSAMVLNNSRRALGMYLAMLSGATVLVISELYIFFTRYLAIQNGTLGEESQLVSLVGSSNDLAIFFGLITVFALLSLVLLPVTNIIRSVLWVVLIASMYFLAVVNLTTLWWIVGAFALAFFVYSATKMSFSKEKRSIQGMSIASLAVLLVAATFILVPATDEKTGTTQFTGVPAKMIGHGEFDVRPSWETTVALGSRSFSEEGALFGAGPGSFYHVWAKYLPASINTSPFWMTDFYYGIGFVPTSIITTGLLGAIAWLLFFGIFLVRGAKYLISLGDIRHGDIVGYVRITSFVSALYLWITTVITVPSPVLLIYAGLLTGVFIASVGFMSEGRQYFRIQFRERPQFAFVTTLLLTVAILGSLGSMYGLFARYSAEASFQKAVTAVAGEGDIDAGYEYINDAIGKTELDIYYRFKSNLDAVRIQNLVAQNQTPEEIREEFEQLLRRAIESGMAAAKLDPQDYQNWTNLGSVYQSIIPMGVDGAVDSAVEQYDNALEYRPNSPTIYYAKAVLERSRGNTEKALEYVREAITMRNQYTDAIFLLAQLQIETGDVENAINSVEAITLFNPQNAVAHFQLGLLHYSQEDFVSAVRSFERSLKISEDYANARYFLALAYWKLGDDAVALENFKEVLKTNEENEEVRMIVANMEAGKEPFDNFSSEPGVEEREGLPIQNVTDGAQFEVDLDEFAE